MRLRLLSGQDLEGTVVAVGSAAVHVSRLPGMDVFDAVVRLDPVATVLIRARGNETFAFRTSWRRSPIAPGSLTFRLVSC